MSIDPYCEPSPVFGEDLIAPEVSNGCFDPSTEKDYALRRNLATAFFWDLKLRKRGMIANCVSSTDYEKNAPSFLKVSNHRYLESLGKGFRGFGSVAQLDRAVAS